MSTMNSGIDLASKTEEIFFHNEDTLPALFNVDSKDKKEGKKIGEGNWTVHEAKWLGRKVAVKKFVAAITFSNVSLTSREVNRMLSLRHPNVLRLLGFYLSVQKDLVLDCTMIMELMDCDLEDYIGKGPLSNDQVVYIIAEVARGMNHVHKRGCFHRDLTPKNILLRKSIVTGFNVDVKIADFGSSELMGVRSIDPEAGTIGYKAPEQFDHESKLCLDKADVFGLGALCFKILTGKKPYENRENVRESMEQIDKATFSQQRNLPEDVVEVKWECLDMNPALRPDFEKISHILDGALSAIQDKMARSLLLLTSSSLHSKGSMSKISHILDGALSVIWDKMACLLCLSSSTSLYSKKSLLKRVQCHDQLNSILHSMGLSREHVVHFIPFDELLVIGLLHEMDYGPLYQVEWKGISYLQKVFFVFDRQMACSYRGEYYFRNLPKLLHKNIVTFMEYSIAPDDSVSIIMELQAMEFSMALGSCKFGERTPNMSGQKRWTIMREIANGMKYLHDQGVVHGDLKPRNVLVSSLDTNEMIVKLIDFANSPLRCPTQYVAVEVLMNRHGNAMDIDAQKVDVFSFGILCLEILGGAPLLDPFSPGKYREAILMGRRPPIPIGTSLEMEALINSCWNEDP